MIYLPVLKLKTKWFDKWTKKNSVSDGELLKTIENISNNLGTSDLGNGLYKTRMPRSGQGKSGGFRTIVVFKEAEIAIFVYGFSKNEKENLDKNELKYFKKLAKDLLKLNHQEIAEMEKEGSFICLKE